MCTSSRLPAQFQVVRGALLGYLSSSLYGSESVRSTTLLLSKWHMFRFWSVEANPLVFPVRNLDVTVQQSDSEIFCLIRVFPDMLIQPVRFVFSWSAARPSEDHLSMEAWRFSPSVCRVVSVPQSKRSHYLSC